MATKQITDLALATSFDTGDLLLIRKSGEGVDKAITQQSFIQTMGNPAIHGFRSEAGDAPNRVALIPSNDVMIDKYYDKMIVTFISPITSTGAVSIGIDGLTYKVMQELGTSTTSTLVTGKYYEAIFDVASNKFYQTNVVTPYIFTNEYVAVGAVQPGETSTKYALTSAIGTPKTATGYYNGMSVLFTADIASKGAVILNVDGLGEKSLQDPVGDDIPFNLLANEAIMAIYDGTVFRKRMFTDVEPIDPDPIDPPADIVINVGPNRAIKTIEDAILQLTRDYGESGRGRTATIQLDSNYSASAVYIQSNTPWITIKSSPSGNAFTGTVIAAKAGYVNFAGIYNCNGHPSFYIDHYTEPYAKAGLGFKNATINYTGASTTSTFLQVRGFPNSTYPSSVITSFSNVNINGYTFIIDDNFALGEGSSSNIQYNEGKVVTPNGEGGNLITSGGNFVINDVDFGTVTRSLPYNPELLNIRGTIKANNVTIKYNGNATILTLNPSSNTQSILTKCSFNNTTTSTKPSVSSSGLLIIDGGDYTHPTSSSSADIVAQDKQGSVIKLRNNPLGSTLAIGKGQIINE